MLQNNARQNSHAFPRETFTIPHMIYNDPKPPGSLAQSTLRNMQRYWEPCIQHSLIVNVII